MPVDWIPLALLALLVLVFLLTLWIALRRPNEAPMYALRDELQAAVRADVQQLDRNLRDEVARSAGNTRSELAQTLATFQRTLLAQQGDVARTQNEQIDSFRTQLASTQQHQADTLGRSGEQQTLSLKRFSDTLIDQLRALSQSNDQRMAEVRTTVEQKLTAIQQDNEKSSSRCARPSTRSSTQRSSSAWAKASSRSPTGSTRCTAASARCRAWRRTWARSAAC